MKTQAQVRAAFWERFTGLKRNAGSQNNQPADTRAAFVDYVDSLQKDGVITEALASRITL